MHSSTMQCWRGGSAEAAPGRAQLDGGDNGFAAGGDRCREQWNSRGRWLWVF